MIQLCKKKKKKIDSLFTIFKKINVQRENKFCKGYTLMKLYTRADFATVFYFLFFVLFCCFDFLF